MLPVAERAAAQNRRCELADIFRNYGEEYRQNHALPLSHLRVMHAVERCRTAPLGGHLQQCDACGFEHPAYNSCRNRHCPKCQSLAKARWLEKQKSELLPVGYFHLVFTLPHDLNRLILVNKKTLINILFQAVTVTLLEFAQTHLKGSLGITAVLHTWDQTLLDHFHLHCLIPAGALSFDQNRWTPARKNFLFHVKALSIIFRAKFLDLLKKALDQKKLLFPGQSARLADPMHPCAVFHHFTSSQPTFSCVASDGCSQSSAQIPPGPLMTTSAAMFAQLNVLVTIPIDNRRCFTQRFSPTGFIQNAPDSHCYYRNALLSHSG